MDKVIYEDEETVKALSGLIVSEDGTFINLKQKDRIVRIAKHRIIKIEQSEGEQDDRSY